MRVRAGVRMPRAPVFFVSSKPKPSDAAVVWSSAALRTRASLMSTTFELAVDTGAALRGVCVAGLTDAAPAFAPMTLASAEAPEAMSGALSLSLS